jgi:hypothetical protein
MAKLEFSDSEHVYRLDGRVIPSVTGILRDEQFIDATWFTEYSRDRGTKVHQAIEFYDVGDLDEETLDPVLRPYLAAWQRFKEEAHVTIEASEVRLASEVYGFAGTIDKVAAIGNVKAILDIKSGQVQPWTGLQLAAYHILLNEPARKRYAVQLNNDGSYRLHEFKDRSDRAVFLAALTVHQWKRREGK